jgi:anti-sigma factor (TIGR02949 family)
MSDCRQITDRLAAYVDGQLPADQRGRIDTHLAMCPPCRRLAERERASHTILRRQAGQLLQEPIPDGLRARCQALCAARGKTPAAATLGPWWRVRLVPVLLTVVVMIFMASAVFSLATRRSDGLLAAQLTADHTKCFRLLGPPDGTAADAGSIEAMLAREYGWQVHLPPSSAAEDIQLIGARRCLYGDGLVPHVMYRVHGRDVSLFVLEGASRRGGDVVTLGHRSQIWSRNGTTFVLVSPADDDRLGSAARYVMREAR